MERQRKTSSIYFSILGTYNNEKGKERVEDCKKCPVGKYCDADTGTVEPTDCPKKSYNPVENGDVRERDLTVFCRFVLLFVLLFRQL